jgi:hypothetical protein
MKARKARFVRLHQRRKPLMSTLFISRRECAEVDVIAFLYRPATHRVAHRNIITRVSCICEGMLDFFSGRPNEGITQRLLLRPWSLGNESKNRSRTNFRRNHGPTVQGALITKRP